MTVRPGMESRVNELSDRWWEQRAVKIEGAISITILRTDSDPNEYILIAVFDSKGNYVANANDPEQDAWYRDSLLAFRAIQSGRMERLCIRASRAGDEVAVIFTLYVALASAHPGGAWETLRHQLCRK